MKHLAILIAIGSLLLAGCDALRTPQPDVRYIAFGDSATDGPADRNYPSFLREQMGEPAQAFAVESESGETSGEGLDRLRSLLQNDIFPNAIALLYWEGGADVVDLIGDLDPLLLFSPSDADYPLASILSDRLDEIQSNVESAIHAGRDAGLTVYVANYFPLQGEGVTCDAALFSLLLPGQAERANEYVSMLNERIESAADAAGAVLVDIAAGGATIAADPSNYFNCNHLSSDGNEIVADVFFTTIQSQSD